MKHLLYFAVALVCGGCAAVDPEPDFQRARSIIEKATGLSSVYDPLAAPPAEQEHIALFTDGLTLDEALKIALLNNRALQAEFAKIGVARAELVQAGLLSNPVLGVTLRFVEGGGRENFALSLPRPHAPGPGLARGDDIQSGGHRRQTRGRPEKVFLRGSRRRRSGTGGGTGR
jgi:outer membrane protein TolC